jgi:hypothetical protein
VLPPIPAPAPITKHTGFFMIFFPYCCPLFYLVKLLTLMMPIVQYKLNVI